MCADCCCCQHEDNNKNLARKNVCCTDIPFLVLFLAFIGGMVYITVFSVQQGDAWRLLYGYDSYGNTCNKPNADITNVSLSGYDTTNMQYVFFMKIYDPARSLEICVSRCPDRPLYTPADVKQFAVDTGSRLCRYDIPVEDYDNWDHYNQNGRGPCPDLPIRPEMALLSRCVPDPAAEENRNTTEAEMAQIVDVLNADDVFRKVLADLYNSWREMLYLSLIALGLSFTMVLLIRFMAAIIVWVVIIVAIIGSLTGTAFLWWTYVQIKNEPSYHENYEVPGLDVDISNETAFLWFSIIATVLTVALLLVIVVMRKRLLLVVALFKEAGKCVVAMPLLLVQPLWTFLILLIFLVYWLVTLAFIGTSDKAMAADPMSEPGSGSDVEQLGVEYEKLPVVRFLFWYHVVGLIWVCEFILASQQFVIAGAVSMWYFTRNKSSACCSCLVAQSSARLTLHHIGSVALGSFIITLVKLPRYILMYINSKLEGSESSCAKCCIKCCICCLWCLEKILKYINQNAYTVIAIKGTNFCSAAQEAFSIIASNALRVTAINSVGDFVLFLGKVGVAASTCAIAVIWLRSKESVHFYAVPAVVVTIFAFLVAHCMLTVYEMVVDALLICFCIDSSLNDGSEGREYYMSRSLMDFVDAQSKDIDEIGGKFQPTTADSSAHAHEMAPLRSAGSKEHV